MRKQIIIGGSTAFGISALLLATGLLKPTVKLVALSSLGIIPVSIIVSENIHRKANQKVLSLEKALGDTKASLKQLENVQDDNDRLSIGIAELKTELSRVQNSLSTVKTENCNLKESLQLAQAQLAVSSSQQAKLSEQVTEYEESYSNELESEVQQKVQEYIAQDREALKSKYRALLEEGEVIYAEAMSISERYKQWAGEVAKRHQDRKAYMMGLTGEFNKRIGEAQEAWEVERGLLLTQIETLNEKVARLQQQLAGDLTESEYGQFGYSVEGKIANDIARWCWDNLQVPLSVKGYQKRSDGAVDVGYGYSHSTPVQALLRDLQRYSENIARSLGIHKIVTVRKLEIADLLVLSFRREPAIKEDDLKRLLTPIDKLATQVIREMSRKGTVRIMGATGDGKGVCARYLLSRIVTTLSWYIRLHDPQHGSEQDHWGIPKVSKSGKELKQALSMITAQMKDREVTKTHSPVTLDILDEIDTQLEKEDKGQFLKLISRIRHLGMKLILIGQNPKVSRAGFQWSDMAQMIAFYQGSSALDAIKNNPALELKKDILLKQYNEISSVFEAKNEWLDDNKKHYFGLCVIPGKNPQWYELPVADEIEIDGKLPVIGESFEITVSNSQFVEGQKSAKAPPSVVAQSRQAPNSAKAETITQQGLTVNTAPPSVIPYVGGNTKSRHTVKTICKKHPNVELSQRKDGRYYCPGCKKRLRKDELAVEDII
ncbi:MAG: hypothetical protein F6J92_04690 [Symploca sp. SIO1A3]|nr:hypothetical protein [Symploca sp. SIO1A3]